MLTTMRNPETPYVAHRVGAPGDQEEGKANNF
jgi:membrane-associated phospholipid phosphatase